MHLDNVIEKDLNDEVLDVIKTMASLLSHDGTGLSAAVTPIKTRDAQLPAEADKRQVVKPQVPYAFLAALMSGQSVFSYRDQAF